MSTAYAHFINVALCCVAVKWCGSMLVIWVCKFWKGITLVENACLNLILKEKHNQGPGSTQETLEVIGVLSRHNVKKGPDVDNSDSQNMH